MAKTIPSMRLLKAAEIPPAAPQANNMVVSVYEKPRKRPNIEPIPAPLVTIGASNPVGPQKPTASAEVIIWE